MRLRDRIALALAGGLGPILLRGLYSSLRFQVMGSENLEAVGGRGGTKGPRGPEGTEGDARPVIFVAWHGRLLPLLYWYRDRGVVMLVSGHRDGEYLARLAAGLGYGAVRGSSTRGGGRAMRELVRIVREGRSLAITPDGPQGPRERMKLGALQVARLSGAPLIPILAGTDRAWWIEGWDRFLVPKPFATIRIAVGRARTVPRDLPTRELEDVAREVEVELAGLKDRVDTVTAE